jgi:hypothetical protein
MSYLLNCMDIATKAAIGGLCVFIIAAVICALVFGVSCIIHRFRNRERR